ncbi:MAG TPA: hypothetical protein VEY08_16175, partial [Chloroflexia bacterium]|nr:hypothetical protein [Chloroflexia bacterium]
MAKRKKQGAVIGKRTQMLSGEIGQGVEQAGSADTQISIRPVVEAPGFMPFVEVRFGTWRGLLVPGQALEVGKYLQEAALGAQYDALLYRYLLHDHEDDPRYHETAT